MDGENTTFYNDGCHARSINSNQRHLSRHWVARLSAELAHIIPEDYRICGENLYAQHSIHYDNLPNYFLVFAIFNNNNICLSWKDTVEFCQTNKLHIVPIIFQGIYNDNLPKQYYTQISKTHITEGVVIRLINSFHYNNVSKSMAKYVCPNHVQTEEHWLSQPIIKNNLII